LATAYTVTLLRFLLLFSLLAAAALRAQQDAPPPVRTFSPWSAQADTPVTRPPGSITLAEDPAVERVMRGFGEQRQNLRGYRVQIFLGSERKTAEDTKRTFLQKYPDVPAYLSWLAPNFRLRVGDLRTRLEAERMLRDLKPLYPGSYIVPDEIEPPKVAGR
jgi:hypothetical protein